MDDSQLVAVVESVEEGCNDVAGLRFGEPLALQDLIEELAASFEFHDEEVVFFVFVDVVKFDNVRVVNLLEDVDLILQANLVLLCQITLGNDFDCNSFFGHPISALSHTSKTSLANDRLDLVVGFDV